MDRDKSNVTHLGCEVVRFYTSECKTCERPMHYRPIFKAPTMCKACVEMFIGMLGDPDAEAAVRKMAEAGRTKWAGR